MKTKTPNNESGSALLLTLGILSLALIVAMAFAFSARTNRQIAKVNADQIKARLLAKSALNRVIAAMKMKTDIYLPESPNLFDGDPKKTELPKFFASSGSDATYDLSNDIHILPVLEQFSTLPSVSYQTEPEPVQQTSPKVDGQFSTLPSVSYQTVTVNRETVGRVAFLVLEEANKLDVNQVLSLSGKIPFVKKDQDRLASFTETDQTDGFLYDISAGEATVSEENTLRLGLQMQELRVASNYFTQLPSGYNDTKAKWFSYTHLWRVLWQDIRNDVRDYPVEGKVFIEPLKYTFFSGEDIEAYWDGRTERQRFDITGYEWRSSSGDYYVEDAINPGKYIPDPLKSGWYHSGTLAGAQGLVDDLVGDSARDDFYSDAQRTTLKAAPGIDASGFGIPYLKTLEDATINQGKQIAANMVDFCDGDDFATTDATWAGNPPTYCGNEKVPYINEMYFEFSLIEDNGTYKRKFR